MFQAGMEALQAHRYADAARHFEALLERFPAHGPLLDRTRVYLDLCHRELGRQSANLRTIEDRLTAATMALNQNDDDQAEALAMSALEESPEQDLALYLLAAVNARRGDHEAALTFLSRAFEARPDARAQARHDPDFEDLRDSDAFQALLEVPMPPPARRPRNGKASGLKSRHSANQR
ncbi:MAG TPA: tetratricopeptide repeat protein [Vicinamibacterales bacterium]|nr:tetratricopeptide repeat protein [Vicinamibacterales bacterium]